MIYLFDNQEQLIHVCNGPSIKSLYQTQTLTDERYVSDIIEAEIASISINLINQVEYFAVPSIEDNHKYHMFFCVKATTEHYVTHLTGVQSGIEELRKSIVKDIRPQNKSVREIANQIIQDTNWTVGYAPDITIDRTNYYYINKFEALKKMCATARVEMQFFIEVNGNRIGNRYIEFKKQLGKKSGKSVVYGHNALKIIREIEKTELVTALVGRGRGEEVSSAESNESGQSGYGRKIMFDEIEWRVEDGKPVNKPKGQIYVEDEEATAKFGIKTSKGNRPKIGIVEFDTDDRDKLLELTYEALQTVNRPLLELKTSSVYLSETEIGDTIRVIRPDHDLYYETRVFEIEWDRLSNKAVSIKLGDRLSVSEGRKMAQLASKVADLETGIAETVDKIVDSLPSADGFNRNYYSETEPKDPRINDIWYKPDPEHEGHYILMIWNGEVWEEIVRTKNFNRVEEYIKEAEAKVKALEEEQAKIQERNQKELDEFRKKIDEMDFDINFDNLTEEQIKEIADKVGYDHQDFDKLKSEIEAVRETSRVNAEMIGNDGVTRYNKNILKGEFDRKILFDEGKVTIEANDGGFKQGETYTISFEALCEMIAKANLQFNFDKEKVRGLTITLTPTNPKFPEVTTDGKAVQVYPDTYAVRLESDWYNTQNQELPVVSDSTADVDLVYREIVDGNLDMKIQVEWAEQPEIIFDGGDG